jgi:hypothetical protein
VQICVNRYQTTGERPNLAKRIKRHSEPMADYINNAFEAAFGREIELELLNIWLS